MTSLLRNPIKKLFIIFFIVVSFLLSQNVALAAVTSTAIAQAANTADATTQTTTSFTPAANNLYLMWTVQSIAATPPTTPTVTCLNGLTMDQVVTRTYSTNATPLRRLTLFRGLRTTAGTNNTCTISWGQTALSYGYTIVGFSGVDTSGTNGANAVAQSVTGSTDGAPAATGLSITLATLQTGSATAGAFSNNDNNGSALVVGTGYTGGTLVRANNLPVALRAEWKDAGSTTVNMTQRTASDIGGIAVEVKQPTPDTSTPTPNPMTFASAPANDSAVQISMTSTTGSDATTPVNYLFTNDNSNCGATAGTGGTTSSWQASTSYSNSGLQANKCYGYTVTARDSVTPTPNTGTASSISSIYTSANTPGTPTLNGATATTLNLTNAENSNPASNPATYFAVQVVTTSPNDGTWLNQWINASGLPSATAIWMTDTQLDALVLGSLQNNTTYGVKVKARNQNNIETSLSAEGTGTTSTAPATPTLTSPTATSITTTGATLGANITSAGVPSTITSRGTCWGTSPAPVTNCVAEGGITTGIFTHARTGMNPGVLYYYRGYATNSTGTGYSSDGTFTTLTITGSVSASPTTCTILSGASTCTVPFTWSISNATSPNLYNANTANQYSTSASGSGVSYPITNGSNTVQARDSSTVLASTVVTASCTSGTSWNGSICAATPAIPTVTSPTATSITTTGATLGANVTSLGVPASISARGTCWGTSPSPVTNCAAEGGTTTGIFTHARTGMSPGVLYYYRGYATNTTGTGYSADGTFTTLSAGTTLSDGATPSNATVAPGSGIIDLDYFTLQTNTGSDTVTAATVTLAPTGAFNNIAQIDITDNSNNTVCTAVTNPASLIVSFSACNITVTTSATTFKVRITPKTHVNMPVPPGASYATAGTITAFTSTNAQSGTDGSSATVTIDNLSPGSTSGELVSAGDAQTSVSWTNPGDSDFSNVVVLRDTATIGSGSTPTEGTSPTVGSSCGGTACQVRYISSGTSFTDTSLTNGTTYYYRFFAKDTHGNYTAYSSTQEVTGTPTATPTTTLSSGTDPASTTIAPGAPETDVNEFTFQTNTGSETITSITVNLSTNSGVSTLALTNSSNATIGSISSPSAGLNTIPVNISVGTGGTTYKVRITPLSHTAMPTTPGATYAITAPITAWVGSYAHTGTDTNTDALAIDNLSPSNVPASSVTAGNAQVSVSWTNPADTDFTTGGSVLVLRNTILVSDTPTEGLTYLLGGSVGASIAACVIGGNPPSTSCTDIGLTNGTPYHYKIFTQDSRGNYSATGAIPSNSPATPSIVVLPTYAITASAGTGGTVLPAGVTDVTQGNSQTYIITPNSGYSIDTLTIDSATTTPVTSYTFTNVQTTHTINATFIAQDAETPTAGPILASITFDGKAFPKGTVSILHKELDVQILDGQQDISNITGSFHVRFVDLPKSIHSFGLLIKDPEGRASQTKFYLVDANATNPLFENIVAPPTIDVLNGQVTRGGVAKIFGYASPSHTVRLYLNDILFKEVLAGNSGVYSFDISTGALDFGQYKVRAKQINLDGGRESDFSTSKNFIVSRLAVVKADLNGDGKVDIRDWSIFLSRWGSKTSLGRTGIDLNGDGKVDIADFSIFIKTVRK